MIPRVHLALLCQALLALQCGTSAVEPAPGEPSPTIVVEGLAMDLDHPDGGRLSVRAARAELEGLPGRSTGGRLHGVEVAVADGAGAATVTATASEGDILDGGALALRRAKVTSAEGLRMRFDAERVVLTPSGSLGAEGVRARLEAAQ